MILKALKLQNIRSYEDGYLEFPKGSILLAGDIGSGKSTILQSIEFALFGIMRGDLDAAAMLRTGTNRGSVTLIFLLGDDEISITRTLVRGKQAITQDTGALCINGVEERLTATELRRRMLELLDYPAALASKSPSLVYRYTVYTSQEQMKEILAQSAQERLQTLRAVFGIDTYSRIKENAAQLIRALRERIAFLEGQLQSEPALEQQLAQAKEEALQLVQRHEQAVKDHDTAKKQAISLEQQLNLLQQTIAALTSVSQTAKSLAQELTTMTQREAELQTRLSLNVKQHDALCKQVEEAGPITIDLEAEQDLLQEKRQLFGLVQKVQQDLQAASARLASVQTKIEAATQAEQKKITLQQEKDTLLVQERELASQLELTAAARAQLESMNADLIAITAAHSTACMERDRLTKFIEHTHESGVCELCLQPVTPEQQELSKEQKKQRLNQVMEAIVVGARDKDELERKRQILTRTIERAQETQAALSRIIGRRQAIEADLGASTERELLDGHLKLIEQEHAMLRTQATELGTQLTAVDTKLEIVRTQKERSLVLLQSQQRIADLARLIQEQKSDITAHQERQQAKKDELARLQAQLSSFDSLKVQEKSITDQRLAHREREETMAQTAARTHALLSSTRLTVIQLETQIASLSAIKTQLTTAVQQRQWLQAYFIGLMDIIEQHVFTTVHADFNGHFQRWLAMLLEDQAISVSLDATLSPNVQQNGYDVEVTQLSGGEKTSVALAYRLALNRVISDVFASIKTKNLLILDEPTDGFSTEQLDRVRDVLTALPAGQLIIVSHEQKVEAFVDHVMRVRKENHCSAII